MVRRNEAELDVHVRVLVLCLLNSFPYNLSVHEDIFAE